MTAQGLDVAGWWHDTVIRDGRLPLLLAFAALLVTFLATRTITRMIRAGRGPFRNVSTGGVHIHHVVPGIVLTLVGGVLAVGAGGNIVARSIAGVLFGMGAGLVLDEFAMIVHLDDVYWSEQGRVSVEATVLAIAVVGLAVTGSVPFDASEPAGTTVGDRVGWVVAVLLTVLVAGITFAKGKFRIGVIGVLVPVVNMVAACRLARPGSPWAERFYRDHPRKLRRATVRAARHDARWDPIRRRFEDTLGGRPSPAPPPPTEPIRTRVTVSGSRHTLCRLSANKRTPAPGLGRTPAPGHGAAMPPHA
ncbi:hypothetical protein [Streptomyces sp. SID3343]|uniref:hypothetical protein n=1 Tax=Streptomyces sp. SID3343 TaxID=2690260 RepID=UPI0031F999AB